MKPHNSEILNHLHSILLFQALPEKVLAFLIENIEIISLGKGQTLFAEGDRGDSMFTVLNGSIGIYLKGRDTEGDQEVARLQEGEIIGEISILTGAPRNATARALTESTLIKITQGVFDEIPFDEPHGRTIIDNKIRERLQKNQLIQILPRIFGPISKEVLDSFITNAAWIHLSRGEKLCDEGSPSNSFFIVITGRLRFLVGRQDQSTAIKGEIGAGKSVGEMGMLTGKPRTATIVAVRESVLVEISAEFFDKISNQHPDLLRGITKIIINRLESTTKGQQQVTGATQFAIIPLSEGYEQLGEKLVKKIQSFGNTALFLDADRFNDLLAIPNAAEFPLDDPNQVRLQAFLDEIESQYEYVVYQAAPNSRNWALRLKIQTDFIFYAADSQDDPDLKPIEQLINQDTQVFEDVRQALLLFHSRSDSFYTPGTSEWLTPRNIQDHFHLEINDDASLARVARYITKRAVGVVLSGGGARGFAHIGVLRALNEAGVPIDFLCGVSAGALVSGLYGVGNTYEGIAEKFLALTKNAADLTIPLVSMIRGRRMAKRMQEMFYQVQIEDLHLPVYCVSSNLSKAKVFVHKTGNLWEAVLASNTPVGFSPPVVLEGDLLMDGNALNNMPADVMAEMINGGKVISVDVSKAVDLTSYPSYGSNGLSGWWVLVSKLLPWMKTIEMPSVLSLIMRSQELSTLMQGEEFSRKYIDLYLVPPVEEFDVLSYEKGGQMVEIGYQYTGQILSERKAELSL